MHARLGVERDADNACGQALLGEILFQLERNAEAASALERAVTLDPQHLGAGFTLGLARLDGDEPEAALQAFNTFCDGMPEDAEGHAFAALAAARAGRREEAVHHDREAHRLEKTQDKSRLRRIYREIKEALAEEA